MLEVQVKPTPKQWEFLTSDADEVLLSGAWGAGKSFPGCTGTYLRALYPGAREGLFRRTLQKLYETTLVTLLEGDGQTPAVIPKGTYAHNQQRRTIKLHGGGTIFYGPAETEEDVNAHNLTGAFVDECTEVKADIWGMLGARCRVKVPGLKPQLRGACNPSTPSHHLAKRFGIRRNVVVPGLAFTGDEKRPIRCHAILTNSFENPYLPPEALARYASYTGITKARYVLGEWVGSDNLIYDNFNRDKHVKIRKGPWDRTIVVIDDGTTAPACILLMRVDSNGRKHFEREVQRAGMLAKEKIQHVRNCGPAESVVVDPAAAGLKAELRAVSLPVLDANNDVEPGIQAVREGFSDGIDGEPGITIDPSCSTLIEQIESYERNPNTQKETPIKENDHGPDTVRYGVMHIQAPPPLVFDASGLVAVEERARRAPRPLVGTLRHDQPNGRDQDLSIADHRVRDISFEEDDGGPLTLWTQIVRGRPARDEDRMLFVAAGDGQGGSPGVIVIADTMRRTVIGQWSKPCAPERLARVAAMLSLWFGTGEGDDEGLQPAPIGYLANTPGLVLGQHLDRIGFGGDAWEPTPQEFAEAVGVLRAAWEGGQLVERDPSVFTVARQYIYANTTMMHASLVGEPERRGSHADALMARAGLWRMMAGVAAKDIEEREAPIGSPEYRKRQRKAKEARAGRIHFG